MAEELSIINEQLGANNDHIVTLYENMETLMSGFQLVLNIITNHESLLNNFTSNQNVSPNSDNPVISETDILVGANEDISTISNVVITENNVSEQSHSTNPEEESKTADNSNPVTNNVNHNDSLNDEMFDDIPIIAPVFDAVVDSVYSENDSKLGSNNVSPGWNSNPDYSGQSSESESGESSYLNSDSQEALQHLPYEKHEKGIFHLFNLNELEKSTQFEKRLNNRSIAYYGDFPYSYGNIVHKPKPFAENLYLTKLLNYVEIAYPDFRFNSAMVTKYTSGNMFIPQHSDSESEIDDDSSILTLSFGESRTFDFLEKDSSFKSSVALNHGDALLMTKKSQRYFTHGIPAEANKGLRVSVTLRLIQEPISAITQPLVTTSTQQEDEIPTSPTIPHHTRIQHSTPKSSQQPHFNDPSMSPIIPPYDTVDTIYVSSSMFRYLNPRGMSSRYQEAKVFFYPGANSTQMINRLFLDPEFKSLDKSKVTKVFVLTGTNNIDAIYAGTETIPEATKSMSALLYKLWMTFDHARINVINLLPREHSGKNEIVKQVNTYLYGECKSHGLQFIDTETGDEPMFTLLNGPRNNVLFSNGFDNVHLNSRGYSRIARYLKYLAHI